MNINLKPEDEQIVRRRLKSGAFASVEEVIHRALESLDAQEEWLQENRADIHDKIERAFGQFERGEGLTAEESVARLEAKKVARRAQHRRV
jgi:putative addiction module CopG family antidote